MSSVALSIRTLDHEPATHQVAPFALLRIAALPYECLEALRIRQTEACIERLLAAEHVMSAQQTVLEQVLYDAVPRVPAEDAGLRRFILKLRRDLHNVRATEVPAAQLARLLEMLDPSAQTALSSWTQAQSEFREAWRQLPELLQTETQQVLRPALRAPLQWVAFRRALAFASPGVERGAARERRLPTSAKPDNLERSLLGYLARAAAKTSPFSSFMTLSVLEVDERSEAPFPSATRPGYQGCVYLNRGVVSRLHLLALAEAARHDDITLRANPTLKAGANGRMHGLCDREVVLLGRPWYEQRWAQFNLAPALTQTLGEVASDSWSGWRRRCEARGIAAAQIEPTLLKLVERGLLMPEPLTDGFDARPLQRLSQRWRASRSTRLQELSGRLEDVDATLAAFATLEGEARIESLRKVRETEQAVLAQLTPEPVQPFDNVVLEDCWLDRLDGTVGRTLLQPLQDLQQFLSTQVIVSPFYERMRNHFVQMFGDGGVCTDVVGFLLRVADKLVDIPEFGARMRETRPTPAPVGVSLPVTVHVQIAAGAPSRPAALVVNRVFDGAGWLAARFTNGEHASRLDLRRQLAAWLTQVSGEREPVDVLLGGHCSDLQAHASITRRVLGWPGEPLRLEPERIVPAESLRLEHNRTTGLLEVFDDAGTPLNLVYLGATFPSPIWGLRYALSILTQPYLLARPSFDPPRDRSNDAVTFEPAIEQGSLVLRRATWWLPSSYLQRVWFAGTPAERLVNVRRECRRHGIPTVCFAQRYIAPERSSLIPADVLNANRKPLWIDLRNPFWLTMLERMAHEGDWVFLTEPLPGPAGLWLHIDGKAHVSELHLEMLIQAADAAVTVAPARPPRRSR